MIRNIINKITNGYKRVDQFAMNHPASLIPLFFVYIVVWLFVAVILLLVTMPIVMTLVGDMSDQYVGLNMTAWENLILIGTLWPVFGHYIYLNIKAFYQANIVVGDRALIFRIFQLFLSITFVFALIYYYLQLFSRNKAFTGLRDIGFDWSKSYVQTYEAFLHIPSVDVIVDYFYFSVITITTLGYGDIHPLSSIAKLACSIQVLVGFIVVVISLGSVVGATAQVSKKLTQKSDHHKE